jgi:hypothetical protein
MHGGGLAAALAVDALTVLGVYLGLGLRRRGRSVVICVAVMTVAVAPRLVGAPSPFPRFAAALVSVTLIAKYYDFGISARRPGWKRPGWGAYLAFLVNIFALVYRMLDGEPQPPPTADRRRLLLGAVGLAAGLGVGWAVFGRDWTKTPLAVEHPVKVLALFGVLLPLDALAVAAWRLVGGRGRQLMRHPYLAVTPADFWRRYNRPVNHFLQMDVFRRVGVREAPLTATMAAFLASAASHEYLFAVTLGKVEGFQSAFFLLQGVFVVATLKLRPRGAWAAVGVAMTLALNLASGLLFFASVGGVVPFYAEGRPAWLRPRSWP